MLQGEPSGTFSHIFFTVQGWGGHPRWTGSLAPTFSKQPGTILSSDHPQVFPSQPESRKGDSELSDLSCPVPPPFQGPRLPHLLLPQCPAQGKDPWLATCPSSCCPVVLGRFSQAGHPASWSPDGLRPGMTPKVTTVVSRTPAENAKLVALWLPLWKCVCVCVINTCVRCCVVSW